MSIFCPAFGIWLGMPRVLVASLESVVFGVFSLVRSFLLALFWVGGKGGGFVPVRSFPLELDAVQFLVSFTTDMT